MPCTDGGVPYPDERAEENSDARAILCGVLTALESYGQLATLLDKVDWREVGVSQSKALIWWTKHKKEDEKRRAAEAAAKRQADIKAAALKKLTPLERKALGLR